MDPSDTTGRLRALIPHRRLEVRRVPLADLHLDPSNARTHGAENLQAIEGSLARFGQAEPLVTQAGTGRVIGGNGRLVAMKWLGWNARSASGKHRSFGPCSKQDVGGVRPGRSAGQTWTSPRVG